jgi:hypothetical protein
MIVMVASVLDRPRIFQSLSDNAKVAGISSVNLRIAAFSVIYSPEFFSGIIASTLHHFDQFPCKKFLAHLNSEVFTTGWKVLKIPRSESPDFTISSESF